MRVKNLMKWNRIWFHCWASRRLCTAHNLLPHSAAFSLQPKSSCTCFQGIKVKYAYLETNFISIIICLELVLLSENENVSECRHAHNPCLLSSDIAEVC